MARIKWTRDRIVLEIRRLHARGERLTSRRMGAIGLGGMVTTAYKLFGSWRAAVQAAGVPEPEPEPHRWTLERITNEILRLAREGRPLSYAQVRKTNRALVDAAYRHPALGNWERALQAAGLEPDQHQQRKRRTRQSIIDEIRQISGRGEPLSFAHVRAQYPRLASAAVSESQFGSWAAAVEAAGFDYEEHRQRRRWTRERILATIKRLHAAGQPLNSTWLGRNGYGALVVAARRPGMFGSWPDAVECAGIDYEQARRAGLQASRSLTGGVVEPDQTGSRGGNDRGGN